MVGGQVSGLLEGSAIVLRNNDADDVIVDRDGGFVFRAALADGSGYLVRVVFDPSRPEQHCVVARGDGTIEGHDVLDVGVTCSTTSFRVGGTIAGLAAGNTISLRNGGETVTFDANGDFAFPTPLPDGAAYDLSIVAAPTSPNQSCSLLRGDGWIDGADATHAVINCTTINYTVGGTVAGLGPASTVVLRITGGETVTRTTNGSFVFPTPRPDGTSYSVTVQSHPSNPRQTCVVANGGGTLNGFNVSNVQVQCEGFSKVAAGLGFLCGLRVVGSIYCEGAGPILPPAGSDFVDIAAGWNHACALRSDGTIACWGNNLHGQTDAPAGTNHVDVAAGHWRSCAVRTDGTLTCWGDGSGTTGSGFTTVDMTYALGCALGAGGAATCWGYFPAETPPAGVSFQQVTAGEYHACGIRLDGAIACWGDNSYGQTDEPAGTDFVAIDAGDDHTCAARSDGTLVCWGGEEYGEATPPASAEWSYVSASYNLSAAISQDDGYIYYWGVF